MPTPCERASTTNGSTVAAGSAGARRISVFVLIDALGWEVLKGRDFLTNVLLYRTSLRTVLGFSSGAIPALLTGVPPAQNGHWNLFYYDPKCSPFRWLRYVSFLPDLVLEHRITRKLLKETGRYVLGLGPLFDCCVSTRLLPWFNWVEKHNIYERGGIAGARSIFDQLAARSIPYCVYTYHSASDAEILRRAERDLRESDARFFFLYLSEMDSFLHMHCNEPEKIDKRLRWYDQGLRRVFEAARRVDPDAGFTVISDHGMTPVRHHHDVEADIEALGLRMPEDYLAVYDSTMARFWFFTNDARRAVINRLESLRCGRIVPDEELQRLGILFTDRRYGEVIFLLHPGWLITRSDFNGSGWMPAAMHGYHPDDPDSDAIFLSKDEPPVPMRTIGDIHQYMLCATKSIEPAEVKSS